MDLRKHRINTVAIHAGEKSKNNSGGSVPDIVMSSSFYLDEEVSFSAENLKEDSPHVYTRWSNPTINVLEKKIAALEMAEDAIALATGMGACTSILLSFLKSGDHMIVSDICYAGVREFCNTTLPDFGVEVTAVNMSDLGAVESALTKPTKLIFIETPCNPILRLTDIEAVANLAHNKGALLVVDSTFATPMVTQPLKLGADLVMHSMTKYLGGHGDSMGGIVAGRRELISQIRSKAVIHYGNVISPFNAWLINRGIITLPLRMKAHSDNGLALAKMLEDDPVVEKVNYPGLESNTQVDLARKQMNMFSGMLSFQVKGDPQKMISRMMKELKIAHYAVSLGSHKTLIFYIPTDQLNQSTFKLSGDNLEAYREYAGEGIFRVSVGLEDPGELYEDIKSTLGD